MEELEVFISFTLFQNGKNAASFSVAQQYVNAFHQLAQKGNTVILPSNVSDVSNAVVQAMKIYQRLSEPMPQEELAEEIDKKPEPLPEPDLERSKT